MAKRLLCFCSSLKKFWGPLLFLYFLFLVLRVMAHRQHAHGTTTRRFVAHHASLEFAQQSCW